MSVGRGHSQTSANTAWDDFIPLAADSSPALLGAWRYMIGIRKRTPMVTRAKQERSSSNARVTPRRRQLTPVTLAVDSAVD